MIFSSFFILLNDKDYNTKKGNINECSPFPYINKNQ